MDIAVRWSHGKWLVESSQGEDALYIYNIDLKRGTCSLCMIMYYPFDDTVAVSSTCELPKRMPKYIRQVVAKWIADKCEITGAKDETGLIV